MKVLTNIKSLSLRIAKRVSIPKKGRYLLAAAASLAFLLTASAQQPAFEKLTGRVTDPAGKPLSNIQLILESGKIREDRSFIPVDSTGSFSINLLEDDYKLLGTYPACFEIRSWQKADDSTLNVVLEWSPNVASQKNDPDGGIAGRIENRIWNEPLELKWRDFSLKVSNPFDFNMKTIATFETPGGGVNVQLETIDCSPWKPVATDYNAK